MLIEDAVQAKNLPCRWSQECLRANRESSPDAIGVGPRGVAWCLTQYYSGFPQPVCSVACPIRQMCSYRVQRFHARGCIIEGMQSTSLCSLSTCSPFTLSAWRMGATLGQDIINRQHVIFLVLCSTLSSGPQVRHGVCVMIRQHGGWPTSFGPSL